MEKIELNIIALANSESSKGNFSLILQEQEGLRRLPILIGAFEAQAIAIHLENKKPKRPLTHDLFKNTLDASEVSLSEVIITSLKGGTFHATLIGEIQNGSPLKVDARASDAIAMAVRFGCSIFTTEEVMQQAGVDLDHNNKAFANKREGLSGYSLKELKQLLKEVLAKEDYESASKIKDAIDRRS
jgi:hypothetical protein